MSVRSSTHLDQSENRNDELDRVTQSRIEQSAKRLTHTHRRLLRREPEQPSCPSATLPTSCNPPNGMIAMNVVTNTAVSEIDLTPPECFAKYNAQPVHQSHPVLGLTDRDEYEQYIPTHQREPFSHNHAQPAGRDRRSDARPVGRAPTDLPVRSE